MPDPIYEYTYNWTGYDVSLNGNGINAYNSNNDIFTSPLTANDWCNNVFTLDYIWWEDIVPEIWKLTNIESL